MNKTNESQAAVTTLNQPQQLVYVVLRYGNIYAVYASIDDAQFAQKMLLAKGQIVDLVPQYVKTSNPS